MYRYKLIALATLLILFFVTVHTLCAQEHIQKNQPLPLFNTLVEIGKTYNCFFTLEEGWVDGEPINGLTYQLIDRDLDNLAQPSLQKKELQQELEVLRLTIPNFTFEIDGKNPQIIHIIDARLAQQKEYPVEAVLQNFEFAGTVQGLVNAIGREGISISPPPFRDLDQGNALDTQTRVHVKGERLGVREALSNFIPLEGRGCIIWTARTKLGQQGMTYVHFLGPPRPRKKEVNE